MPFTNKRVLVTGAAGFIGSHLVQRLLALGGKVRAMTHYRSEPSLHNLKFLTQDEMTRVEVIRGNIEDAYFVRDAVEGCDTVFHLAALVDIPYSYIAPASYVATNVQGTLNVLEACRREGTPRLVHTSTSECYGTARYTPINEEHPLQGQSPYSASKIAADKIVESYYKSFELPVVTIRPFNTFGPRQSARAVIPTIIVQLMSGAKSLKLGALAPVRDFTFVADTAEGLIRGASAGDVSGETFNLGFGKGIAIGELARRIMDLASITVPIETEELRLRPPGSEVMALISDNSRTLARLGWSPQISLENGLLQTIEFVHQHSEFYRANSHGV
jgi:NAD dependent epimerase/dehydratase